MYAFSLLIGLLLLSGSMPSPVLHGEEVDDLKKAENSEIVESSVEFPFLVYVYIGYKVIIKERIKHEDTGCGGIIFSTNIVLTAAHCIEITNIQKITNIRVIAGVKNLRHESTGIQNKAVKGYKIHKDYKNTQKRWIFRDIYNPNDIALIWLKEEFELTKWVQIANLPKKKVDVNKKTGVSAGWGQTECGTYSDILRKVSLRGIAKTVCEDKFSDVALTKNVFCVASIDQKSIVSLGDSGGPFVYDNTVLGIVSFGKVQKTVVPNYRKLIPICNPTYPAVYTDLYSYRNWIETSLREGAPNKTCTEFGKFCAL